MNLIFAKLKKINEKFSLKCEDFINSINIETENTDKLDNLLLTDDKNNNNNTNISLNFLRKIFLKILKESNISLEKESFKSFNFAKSQRLIIRRDIR